MIHRIYTDMENEGSIVPVPLIAIGVAIAFPMVVMGMVITKAYGWLKGLGGKADDK